MNQLAWDDDAEKRREAALALGEILRSSKLKSRRQIVSVLQSSRAEGKPAIPARIELTHDEDEELRKRAQSAIEQIDPNEFAKLSTKE